jgi:hypothetical protein
MSRIARAKPQPIGRADVPASLEELLRRTMSRRPEQRPASALEFVRELEQIETELGLPQTPIEVATDDWALGTVSDLEDRTRLRPLASGRDAGPARRRRRAAAPASGSAPAAVRTVHEATSPKRLTGASPWRLMQRTTWVLVGAAALVVVLGAITLVVLLRATATSHEIPVVSDIAARQQGDTVVFTWPDPGLQSGDVYQVATGTDAPATQPSARFVVSASPGQTVCITVTVNRDGKTGDPSAQKCLDVDAR